MSRERGEREKAAEGEQTKLERASRNQTHRPVWGRTSGSGSSGGGCVASSCTSSAPASISGRRKSAALQAFVVVSRA